MTTTSTMQGLGTDEKPTSRVLRPPGGGSSDIFGSGGNQEPSQGQRRQFNNRGGSDIFGTSDQSSPQGGGTPNRQGNSSHSNIFGAEEHKIYGKGRNQSRGKFNPITGEQYAEDSSPSPVDIAPKKETPQASAASPAVGGASPQTGQGDSDGLQAAPGKAQPEVRTSSRVLNPPGGHTHKLW